MHASIVHHAGQPRGVGPILALTFQAVWTTRLAPGPGQLGDLAQSRAAED